VSTASLPPTDADFENLQPPATREQALATLDRLAEMLIEKRDFHRLFDARMIRKKFELGLPLNRPSSLGDVPGELRKEVEASYAEAAREVGRRFLDAGEIGQAWTYYQVLREPGPVAEALENISPTMESSDRLEELIHVALIQGVNPSKGLQLMLRAHGTCSTITTLDQSLQNLTPEQRQSCARVMVRSLYDDVTESVRRDVERRIPGLPPGESLRSLLTGRDWLLESGNYHVDVSHLHAVIRFARSLEAPAEELDLALQLCEYGQRLAEPLQYAGEPPFVDYYPAHAAFFRALLDKDREKSLQYFRDQLANEPDDADKPLLAYVLVDLLSRVGRLDEAVDVASQWLTNLSEDVRVSFSELCLQAHRTDALRDAARRNGDLVTYATALVSSISSESKS
jgi:tetratricopeptide (TPR) repeat protein